MIKKLETAEMLNVFWTIGPPPYPPQKKREKKQKI